MNREQKIEQIKNRDRVSRVSNLVITPKYIDPDYQSEHCSGIETDTGYLEILKLVPKSGSDPYFVGRWDQRPEEFDLDICSASESANRKFKNGKDGYEGHHTVRSTNLDQRIFEVKIKIPPERIIFDGEISFNNTYETHVVAQAEATMTCDAVVIPAAKKDVV